MRHIPSIARVLTGPIFFIFGLNGFLNFIPTPPPQGIAGQFLYPVLWARTKELSFFWRRSNCAIFCAGPVSAIFRGTTRPLQALNGSRSNGRPSKENRRLASISSWGRTSRRWPPIWRAN